MELRWRSCLWHILPQRALYWPLHDCLLLADLHLGKADTFRQHGIGIPQQLQHNDLAALEAALQHCQPQRCLILGDFVHGAVVAEATAQRWNALVHRFAHTTFELVVGNHDRAWASAGLQMHHVHRALQLGDVWCTHEPMAAAQLQAAGQLNVHGHLHPAVRLPGSARKLAALVLQPPYMCLPAFSAFTAGPLVKAPYEALWVFDPLGQEVVRLR